MEQELPLPSSAKPIYCEVDEDAHSELNQRVQTALRTAPRLRGRAWLSFTSCHYSICAAPFMARFVAPCITWRQGSGSRRSMRHVWSTCLALLEVAPRVGLAVKLGPALGV